MDAKSIALCDNNPAEAEAFRVSNTEVLARLGE